MIKEVRPFLIYRLFYELNFIGFYKPLFIMAKIDLKFLDKYDSDITIKTIVCEELSDIFISIRNEDEGFGIWLDKSTAIKFAKTLRTEINKIQEGGSNV